MKLARWIAFSIVLSTMDVAGSPYPRSTEDDISSLCHAVALFREETGAYPESFDAMLKARPKWRVPEDLWEREYNYSLSKPDIATRDATFYIWTLGKNGEVGGYGEEADVGSWNLRPPWSSTCQ